MTHPPQPEPQPGSSPVLIKLILGTTGSTAGLFNGCSTSVLSNPACISYLLTYYPTFRSNSVPPPCTAPYFSLRLVPSLGCQWAACCNVQVQRCRERKLFSAVRIASVDLPVTDRQTDSQTDNCKISIIMMMMMMMMMMISTVNLSV